MPLPTSRPARRDNYADIIRALEAIVQKLTDLGDEWLASAVAQDRKRQILKTTTTFSSESRSLRRQIESLHRECSTARTALRSSGDRYRVEADPLPPIGLRIAPTSSTITPAKPGPADCSSLGRCARESSPLG